MRRCNTAALKHYALLRKGYKAVARLNQRVVALRGSHSIAKKTKSKAPALEAKNQIKNPYCSTADEAAVEVESLRDACFIASRCSTPISFAPEFRPKRKSSHTL